MLTLFPQHQWNFPEVNLNGESHFKKMFFLEVTNGLLLVPFFEKRKLWS